MAIEDRLERVVRDIYRIRARGGRWVQRRQIRLELQSIWSQTDILAGELCDVLRISMEELDSLLDESKNQVEYKEKKDCWEQNIEAGVPLFIPIKITGI
jgi:RNA polymerase-interacting CarD/CdnL/TRCF family regulator